MPGLNFRLRKTPVRYSRTQTGVRTSPVVVRGPGVENLTDMRFVERNHEIQTFSACATDQAFTESIRLWTFVRCFQYAHAQRLQGCVQFSRVNVVAVVDEKPIPFVAANTFSKLLKRTQALNFAIAAEEFWH